MFFNKINQIINMIKAKKCTFRFFKFSASNANQGQVMLLAVLIIGLSAFWAEDTSAFRWIYDKMLWIFGGIFLPFSILPDKYQSLIQLLPFNQMLYAPARMIVSFNIQEFYKNFVIQIVWIIILSLLVRWMYKKGTKNLSVNAG